MHPAPEPPAPAVWVHCPRCEEQQARVRSTTTLGIRFVCCEDCGYTYELEAERAA